MSPFGSEWTKFTIVVNVPVIVEEPEFVPNHKMLSHFPSRLVLADQLHNIRRPVKLGTISIIVSKRMVLCDVIMTL